MRYIPILVIILGLCVFFYVGGAEYLSYEMLRQSHKELRAFAADHTILMMAGCFFGYIAIVLFSVPGALFATLAIGYLFGVWPGVLLVIGAATIGASLLFLSVKMSIGPCVEKKIHRYLPYFERKFQRNAFYLLLFLRLIPIFPFWVINLVPAFLDIPFKTFVSATFLGIIPVSFVYVILGNNLSLLFSKYETLTVSIFYSPQILVPFSILAILSLTPLIYRYLKKNHPYD